MVKLTPTVIIMSHLLTMLTCLNVGNKRLEESR